MIINNFIVYNYWTVQNINVCVRIEGIKEYLATLHKKYSPATGCQIKANLHKKC